MRALLILLLVSSTALFAADDTPEERRETAIIHSRALLNWENLTAEEKIAKADELAAKQTEIWNKYQVEQLAVMTAGCPSGTDCVTSEQKDLLAAQVRIAVGLVVAKSKWIKEGKTVAERNAAETNYNKCANENKDCDKLPETERNTALEARGSVTTTVVVTPSTDVQAELATGIAALAQELQAKRDEFLKNNPSPEGGGVTAAQKEFLLANINERMEKELALMKALCDKNPGTASVCSEEAINKVKDLAASTACLLSRGADKKDADVSNHAAQWNDLPAPKSCQTLLDLDAKPVVTPDVDTTPTVVNEDDDEKSPRNYKAETCKWVSDLPRKIVNGPSCGKTRSQICTGYVVCEQKNGGGKFIRMSTCGPGKCGGTDEDAVSCTKDQGYWSKKPASETKLFMSKKLKETLSGTEAQ